MPFKHRYRCLAHRARQHPLDLGAGGVPACVQHAERVVPALPAQGQGSIVGQIEDGTAPAQPGHRRRAGGQDRGYRARLTQARARCERIGRVPFG